MKILFLDIDGTLVDYSLHTPDSAIRAIRQTRSLGNRVYLTTGRSKAEVYPELWDIGLDGMIGGNGMYIEDGGKVLQDLAMPRGEVRRTVAWMQENGLGFYLESKNGLFGSENLPEKAAMAIYGAADAALQQKISKGFPTMVYGQTFDREDVAKISFALAPNLLEDAKTLFGGTLQVSSWSASGQKPEFGEFALPGVDKVNAVKTLLRHLGASQADTLAFGDAESDRKMIEYCAEGVAMGNAPQALKDAADDVTDAVEADGLWNAFVRHGLL